MLRVVIAEKGELTVFGAEKTKSLLKLHFTGRFRVFPTR
jgi:hypothetical protein